MKDCEVFRKGLCTGCEGLGQADWCGQEQCETYKEYKNKSGLDICKEILRGDKQCQMKI